jgi:hypothetical protein
MVSVMNDRTSELLELLKTRPNMTNFGRSLKLSNLDLYNWIMIHPDGFPSDASLNERLYVIENKLSERPILNGVIRKFVNYSMGYFKTGHPSDIQGNLENLRVIAPTVGVKWGAFPRKYPELAHFVRKETSYFRENTGMSERAYCLINEITEQPKSRFLDFGRGYPRGPSKVDTEAELLSYAKMVGSDQISIGSKVKKFLKRNRERNADLYELPESEKDVSYIVCPVLCIRTLNIKSTYVEGVLGMSMDDFRKRFPDQPFSCSGHQNRIATGLAVEVEPGVTRHALSVVKSTAVRAEIGEDGLSINARKGRKTRATLMKRDENGLNGWQRLAKYRNETILENGFSIQQNALRSRIDKRIERGENGRLVGASKVSKRILKPLINFLEDNDLKFYFDRSEYGIKSGNNYYFYDLVIPALSLCVEFQGTNFHPSPNADFSTWKQVFTKRSAEYVKSYDEQKAIALLEQRGYETKYVYESQPEISWLIEEVKNKFFTSKEKNGCQT